MAHQPPTVTPTDMPEEVKDLNVEKEHTSEAIEVFEVATPTSTVEPSRIWRKLDVRLLPFIALLYLLAFLDRSNVGNARIAGMAVDLNLYGLRYNVAAAVFFIPYSFAEVPSNIIIKLVGPSVWIPTIMVVWGLIMTLMCLVNTFAGLVVARAFLGLAEAGLFPGAVYYLSMWYPRHMRATRFAIFSSAANLSGAFGGLLAFAIEHLDGKAGLHGWQWIFLIEGLVTTVVAFASYTFFADSPKTAKFLSSAERTFILDALEADAGKEETRFDRKYVYEALKDWKSWVLALIFIGSVYLFSPVFCQSSRLSRVSPGVYAVALFAPSIIASLGYSAARAQLLSVPPNFCGCIYTITMATLSDRFRIRGPFIIFNSCVSMFGYVLAYATSAPGPGYIAIFFATMGVYANSPIISAWVGGNVAGDVKRGVVLAMAIGTGNLWALCSSLVFFDPPRYHHGHGTIIGTLILNIVCTTILMWRYRTVNKAREELCHREGITEDNANEVRAMGDNSPLFRYIL
ncbi:MFS general substrate transporter [Amylostereum chailletii]|nr:MFS general substrate transporter [Amylostereum chailletii]